MQDQVFVDRDSELARLKKLMDTALAGAGQICLIRGEAGTGKTALVNRFVEQAFAASAEVVLAMGTCNAQTGIGDPYLPFREALAMLTGDNGPRPAATGLSPENSRRLATVAVRSIQVLVEVAPELVGAFVPGAKLLGALGKAVAQKVGWMDRLEDLTKKKALAAQGAAAAVEQGRIVEQYTAFVQQLTNKVPLILFVDDLQWADTASLHLLFHLGRHLENRRLLILGAYRPNDVAVGRNGERHPLEPIVNEFTRYYGDITVDLDAIPEAGNRQFISALLDSEPNHLGESFREALFQHTGGQALFTVELLRAMRERGDLVRDGNGAWVAGPALDWSRLPARVEGVIEERIDRLSPELREMLKVASVEGAEFTAEVAARVQGLPEREAIRQISRDLEARHRLVNGVGLLRIGPVRLSRFRFAHSLFQQYLYSSLTEAERVYLHRDVGQALEAMVGTQTEEIAAPLARHFEEAGIPAKAAVYRLQAGNRARRVSAHQEAIAHLTRGLELVAGLPPGPDTQRLELELQVSLGTALIAVYGYASPRVDQVFARARALCTVLGDPPQAIPVLLGQAVFYLMRGELEQARSDGNQVLGMVQDGGEADYALVSHVLLGAAAMYEANYDESRQHLEQVVAAYDPVRHQHLAYIQGQDPGVRALSFLSRVLWLQGYPEQAQAQNRAAIRLAETTNHPYSQTVATLHAATLHYFLRQWLECQAHAEQALQLAREHHFRLWEANATILQGVALAHQNHLPEGIAALMQGLFLWEATGAGLVSYARACLADAYLIADRREEGLQAVDESLYRGKEAWWLPEQHRLRAELLLLAPGAEAEAEATLRHAMDLAQAQKARSLELRVAISLVRLLQRQGQEDRVRGPLAGCYAWFREGLSTPDLVEARQLLDSLAS